MQRNMAQWRRTAAEERRALPLLSFPSIQLMGVTVRELISDSGLQARGMAEIARRCPAAAAVSMMDLSVEAECFGAPVRFFDSEAPTVAGPVLKTPEDAAAMQAPAVGAGRTGIYVEAVSRALEQITDRPVFAGVIGPFSLAGRLMGMTDVMINCYVQPEMVRVTLEKAAGFLLQYILAYKAAGANGVVMAEPAAGLLPPELCGEFSSAYIKKIVDAVQDDSFLVIYHNCGPAVCRMIPEILSVGAAAYHFGNAVRMEDILAQMPEDVLTMGNVDPAAAFCQGTPEKVRGDTLAVMEACCKYRNFLISSGCDIPPSSPWENIGAFFAAVEEFYSR